MKEMGLDEELWGFKQLLGILNRFWRHRLRSESRFMLTGTDRTPGMTETEAHSAKPP